MKKMKNLVSLLLLAALLIGIAGMAAPAVSAATMDSSWTYDQYLANYYLTYSQLDYLMNEDELPFQTYVNNPGTNIEGAVNTWRTLTMSVSDHASYTDKEVEFYILLIYDVVYQKLSEDTMLENFDTAADAVEASTLAELAKLAGEEAFTLTLKTELTSDNIVSVCEQLLSAGELEDLAAYSEAIIKGADKLDTVEDLFEKLTMMKEFARCTEEVYDVLWDMYGMADDALLKEALRQMALVSTGLLTNSEIDAIFSDEVVANEIVGYALDKLWDVTKKAVPILGGVLTSVEYGQKVGKLACSILFSTDAVCENWYSMQKVTIFEETLKSCLEDYISDFESNPTAENAKLLNRAADMYFATLSVGMEYAINYAEAAKGGGLIGWLYKTFHDDDYQLLMDTLNNIKNNIDAGMLFVTNYSYNCYLAALEALLAEEGIDMDDWQSTAVTGSESDLVEQQEDMDGYLYRLTDQTVLLDTTLTEDMSTFGDFTVKSGALLDLDSHTLTVGGDFHLKAGTLNVNTGSLVIRGDLYLESASSALNMGTGSITVEGSIYHGYGKLDMEQGSLTAAGDYRIQRMSTASDGTVSWSQSYGYLRMEYDKAEIAVGGDFVMHSRYDTDSTYNAFSAGTLAVAGDFRVIDCTSSGSDNNFDTSGTHKVILNGTEAQTVCFTTSYSYYTNSFATLEVQNEAGIILQGYFSADSLTTTLDHVTAVSDGAVIRKLTLAAPLHITGDVEIASGTVLLQTHMLRVEGDLVQSSGTLTVKAGILEVTGDYRIQTKSTADDGSVTWSGSYGKLSMENAEGQVIVGGNFVVHCSGSSAYMALTAGTMTLGGDFTQQNGNYNNYFTPSGTHKVILNGTETQTVSFGSQYCYFNTLEIRNPAGVNLSGYFRAATVTTTLEQALLHPGQAQIAGMTLAAPVTITDSVQITGDVSLQTNTLTVQGDLIQSGGTMKIDTGVLHVTGDYRPAGDADTESWTSGSELVMEADEAQVIVDGSYYSYHDYGTKSAGTITVSGDCLHTGGFQSTLNHKVILNGTEPQRVGITSSAYYFATLEVQNEAGLILENYFRVGSLTSTLGQVSAVSNGALLHNVTLDIPMVITGDVSAYGTVSLQTHTLRIDGDLVHANGGMKIDQGTLEVTGDYRIQRKTTADDGTVTWSQSDGYLQMTDEAARVTVGGDFVMQSYYKTESSHNQFTAGTLTVGGDFTQVDSNSSYSYYNFQCSGTHKVVLNGTEPQTVSLQSQSNYFATVEVRNEAGLIFSGCFRATTLTSTLEMIQAVSDNGDLRFTLASPMTITGDGGHMQYITLSAPLHITGDVQMGTTYLQTNTLSIDGSLYHTGGIMYVEQGSLEIAGDYRIQSVSTGSDGEKVYGSCNGALRMENAEGRVTVGGSFITNGTGSGSGYQTGGVITVGGDFIQMNGYDNIAPSGTHVILNGTAPQTVSFGSAKSFFDTLEVQNEAGLNLTNYFSANSLTTTLDRVTAVSNGVTICKLTLNTSLDITGNVQMNSGNVSLQSHTLKIDGSLTQPSGVMLVGTGALEVTGDYRIQTRSTADDGSVTWGSSSGALRMTNAEARVTVGGDFAIYSTKKASSSSGYNYLTAGTMTVSGDFTSMGGYGAFKPAGMLMVLNGTEPQTVSFVGGSAYFDILEVRNEAGLILAGNFQTNVLRSPLEQVTAVASEPGISGMTLQVPLTITGDVNLYGGNMCLQTYTLRIEGDLVNSSCVMKIEQGTLEVTGDYRIQRKTTADDGTVTWSESSGYLQMSDEAARVTVGGDFVMQSYYSDGSKYNYLYAGTMSIGGDFIQIPSSYSTYNNFSPYGTHKVVLNGTGPQTVSFGSSNSKFNILDLHQEGSQYTFSRVPCWNTLLNNGEAHTHTHIQTLVEPTCTEQGYTITACYCGDSTKLDYTDALGHSFGEYTCDENATCTADGTKTAVCERCGTTDTVTDEGSARGHSWDEGVVTTEATEETTGLMTYTCGTCGEIRTEEIPVLEHVHDYAAQITVPTCEEAGFTTYTCRCGDSYEADIVKALGHSVEDCVCTVCGKTFVQMIRQPVSVTVAEGEMAYVDFEIEGEDLTYEWYYAAPGSEEFIRTRAFSGNSYYVTMNPARDGRRIYCVVTDIYGNTVTTDTVTISMIPVEPVLEITRQPVSVTAAEGEMAYVDFEAQGEDLSYEWYYAAEDSDTFVKTRAFSGNSYYVTMNLARDGRRIYCVVTDIYGNSVTTDTVTLSMVESAVAILSQPESVSVANGEYAIVTVEAQGEGLTYEWYYSDNGGSKYYKTTAFTGNTYKIQMNSSRNGRMLYCVITDQYGNSVTTDIAVISMKTTTQVNILTQPVSVTVAEGEYAIVTVEAQGEGLTYEWYYSDNGGSKYYKTTAFTGNTYKVQMNSSRNGRMLYCVITDQYGNSVTTDVVTIGMAG